MVNYLKHLPRLTRLRMFEAAARLQSFTLAAQELNVTQAAVSQQVRTLEQELGVTLFVRLHRGLDLTEQGQELFRTVSTALGQIATVAENMRAASRPPVIRVGVTFAVATFWLIPRLPAFRAAHPELDVHLIATDRGFDSVADQVDIGVAFGDGAWAGFTPTLLKESTVFPVCSPDYAAAHPEMHGVDDLLNQMLLSMEDDRPGRLDWGEWFARLGIDGSRASRTLKFNSHPLVIQAACEGQGVALGWTLLTDDLIASGRLVKPVDVFVKIPKSFFFVERQDKVTTHTKLFKDWILQSV
ncbi:LysR substrate-binding domain-containing protein [Rhodoligotrophos defluvii]|uniref:LysR substrate-binding domain-containing protein n=1 Tax=Rhodoligotrophos defluvii TaxID=2561934 RepID=UPI00148531F0|nr:LysR substrate-binding domain-containing protein [Rhodoligotrophos defluvii]